jgi:TonB family protein
MAQHFISRLGPFDSQQTPDSDTSVSNQSERPGTPNAVLSQLGSSLARDYATTPAIEVALDLVLNEIAHHARLATTAPGAVVGLLRGSEMVCRAATGAYAPDFAALLNSRPTILGACLQSGAVQRCDDAEKDPRIDPMACRRLGVRSLVLVPVFDKSDRAAGVFAVFSPRAGAFSEREVLTLQALARRVTTSADLVKRAMALPSESTVPSFAGLSTSSPARTRFSLLPDMQRIKTPVRDGRLLLMIAVIAVAVSLGWVLGRSHRLPAAVQTVERPVAAPLPQLQPAPEPAVAVVSPVAATANAGGVQTPATATDAGATAPSGSAVQAKGDKDTPSVSSVPQASPKPAQSAKITAGSAPRAKAQSASKKSADGVLILFENKKLAAQAERSQAAPQPLQTAPRTLPAPQPPLRAALQGPPIPAQTLATTTAASGAAPPLALPEITALANLVHRVEPQYPPTARQQRIQGRVVLNILVSKDGSVQVVTPSSGDPQLSRAAVDAVRQWHFKPLVRNAQQVSFNSHVTLDFALP